MQTTTLTSYRRPTETARAAIERAAAEGLTLCAYESPTEGARDGLSVADAAELAQEDPSLIYLCDLPEVGPCPACGRSGIDWAVQAQCPACGHRA